MPLLPDLTDLSATVTPTVSVNSIDLLPTVQPKLRRTVVDTRLHLPDMFELTFEEAGEAPHFKCGIMQAAARHAGAVEPRAELSQYDGHRAVYRISWS